MESNLIFLDCDGVLANFVGSACNLHGWDASKVDNWDFFKDHGLSREEFFAPIIAQGAEFALGLETYDWSKNLWRMCDAMGTTTILTAPWDCPEAWGARVRWLTELGVDFSQIALVPRHHKIHFATSRGSVPNILIDDSDENIRAFNLAGGMGLLWPAPWNELREYVPMLQDRSHAVIGALQKALRLVRQHGIGMDPLKWIEI